MVNISSIQNFSRKFIPAISSITKENIAHIRNIPEMRLTNLIKLGAKNIAHVDMNHCTVAIIRRGGVDTIFTDGLNGCNAVAAIFRTRKKEPIVMLSHYVPTQVQHQAEIFETLLARPELNIDPTYTPRIFLNIRGKKVNGQLKAEDNPIIDAVKNCVNKFFGKNPQITITPYELGSQSPFASHANILQVNQATNTMKITSVGEKEAFFDLLA